VTIAIIVVLAAGLVVLSGLLIDRARRRKRPLPTGTGPAGVPAAPPHPDGPAFTIVDRQAGGGTSPGFAVRHGTAGRRQNARPGGGRTVRHGPLAGAPGFSFVVTDNPTAVCKLTGRQVGQCSCAKHRRKGTS